MADKKEKEIIGYFKDDRSIYCVDCILKNQEMMKKKIESLYSHSFFQKPEIQSEDEVIVTIKNSKLMLTK